MDYVRDHHKRVKTMPKKILFIAEVLELGTPHFGEDLFTMISKIIHSGEARMEIGLEELDRVMDLIGSMESP